MTCLRASTSAASAVNFTRSRGMGRCSTVPSQSRWVKWSIAMGSCSPMYPDDLKMAVDLLLCVATEFEGALLRDRLDGSDPGIAIVRTGVGPVNAAHAVTLFLAQADARAIVVCGVGGAYPSSGLSIGDVVCAATECYGDLGATSPSGFLDMKALGFPLVEGPPPLFNDLPMEIFPVERRVPFVTVSSCTGTEMVARELETRTGGAVESMEGAAI